MMKEEQFYITPVSRVSAVVAPFVVSDVTFTPTPEVEATLVFSPLKGVQPFFIGVIIV